MHSTMFNMIKCNLDLLIRCIIPNYKQVTKAFALKPSNNNKNTFNYKKRKTVLVTHFKNKLSRVLTIIFTGKHLLTFAGKMM